MAVADFGDPTGEIIERYDAIKQTKDALSDFMAKKMDNVMFNEIMKGTQVAAAEKATLRQQEFIQQRQQQQNSNLMNRQTQMQMEAERLRQHQVMKELAATKTLEKLLGRS